MKRLLILLILLFALPAYAQQCSEENPCPEVARLSPAMMGSTPVAASGCADGFELCSEFPNLTGWTADSGSWAAAGTLTKTATDDSILRYNTPLANAYRQYAKAKIAVHVGGTGDYPYFGFMFRATGATGWRYGVYFLGSFGSQWHYFDGGTYGGQNGDTPGDINPPYLQGYWIGAEVEGTGTDTVFRTWNWDVDPGPRGSWGAARVTYDGTPNQVAEGGTSLYTGFAWAIDASSVTTALDAWFAGSSAVGP